MLIVNDSDALPSGNRVPGNWRVLSPAAAAFPKLPGIDAAAAIERLGDDVELYLELVRGFIATQAEVPDELSALLEARRWPDAERVAHTAKSLAATVGADELAARASAMEDALRSGETGASLASMLARLRTELARVIGLLEVVLATGGADPAATSAVRTAPTLECGRPTILAVDDAPANLTVLAGVLGDDYDVVVADSGASALDYLTQSTLPELILLDVTMPAMDGYEVCRRLKTDPRLVEIPVIFVTART